LLFALFDATPAGRRLRERRRLQNDAIRTIPAVLSRNSKGSGKDTVNFSPLPMKVGDAASIPRLAIATAEGLTAHVSQEYCIDKCYKKCAQCDSSNDQGCECHDNCDQSCGLDNASFLVGLTSFALVCCCCVAIAAGVFYGQRKKRGSTATAESVEHDVKFTNPLAEERD
jgi:hypothetical protein